MQGLYVTEDVFSQINRSIEHYAPTVILIIAVFAVLGFIAYRAHYRNK